jgi:phage replication-related protein YjqB (UPF0714/DUF867 family)
VERPQITTRPVAVTDSGHLTEFLYDDAENDDLLVCAGHAGDVEPGTGELAVELAMVLSNATCWACFGHDDDVGAYDAWHPPSKAISPDEYPLLDRISDRGFDTVVSLHGLDGDEVLVGGATTEAFKSEIRDALDSALSLPVRTVSDGPYGGTHPENFVNWLAADSGGLQLELGGVARADESGAVSEVLASVCRSRSDGE